MSDRTVIEKLAEEYPVLYLNPDTDAQDVYRSVVLRGEEPFKKNLFHYTGNTRDCMETVETPAGPVQVVTLRNCSSV